MNQRRAINEGTGPKPPERKAPIPSERPAHAPRSLSERERAQQRSEASEDNQEADRSEAQDAQNAPLPSEEESQNQETG